MSQPPRNPVVYQAACWVGMEKRFYPRVETNLSAVIANDAGVRVHVVALDASSEGICVECNASETGMITPEGNSLCEDWPVELLVWLNLPDEDVGSVQIEVRCRVAFTRRTENDRCKIGLRYLDLEKTDYDRLIRFIRLAVKPHDR